MHEYVQKSTSTTLPRRWLNVRAWLPGVLNHAVMPVKFGARPRLGRFVLLAMNTAAFCGDVPVACGAVVVVARPAARCPLCEVPASVAAQVAFFPSKCALAAANWFW